MLCRCCHELLTNPLFSKLSAFSFDFKPGNFLGSRIHHESYDSFEAAIKSSCGLCHRLLQKKQRRKAPVFDGLRLHGDVDPSTFSMRSRLSIETESKNVVSVLTMFTAKNKGKLTWFVNQVFFYLSPDQFELGKKETPSAYNDINSSAFRIIENWVSKCRSEHPECKRNATFPGGYPFARILDVGEQGINAAARLKSSSEIPENRDYMTLSHCWGGVEIPKLIQSNFEDYLEHIPEKDVTKTFQEAIDITRAFGKRYLWIDSLCIIQDSEDDWLDQAKVMGDIYQGSYLNIAATQSQNPHGGLFIERNSVLIEATRVVIPIPEDSKDEKRYFDLGTHFIPKWSENITQSALCKRAWVVQERALVPRTVHFARDQVFWECVKVRACEEAPHVPIGSPFYMNANSMVDFKRWDPFAAWLMEEPIAVPLKTSYLQLCLEILGIPETDMSVQALPKEWEPTHPLLVYWAGILQCYASAGLSYQNDRLVAIAGLARIVFARLGIRYIAGLWLHQLPRQLLWYPVHMKRDLASKEYLAPSWSWAACTEGLAIRTLRLDPILEKRGVVDLIKILSVDIEPHRHDDFFGRLDGGKLRVRGRLFPVSLKFSKLQIGYSSGKGPIPFFMPSTTNEPTGKTFLLPVLIIQWDQKTATANPNALILEALEERGTFKRIAAARLSNSFKFLQSDEENSASSCFADEEFGVNDDEIKPDNLSEPNMLEKESALPVTPQDELSEKRVSAFSSDETRLFLTSALVKNTAVSKEKLAASAILFDRLKISTNQIPQQQANKASSSSSRVFTPRVKMPKRAQEQQKQRAETSEGEAKGNAVGKENTANQGKQVISREIVEPKYYLEYIENDNDVMQYGNFIFDIV